MIFIKVPQITVFKKSKRERRLRESNRPCRKRKKALKTNRRRILN